MAQEAVDLVRTVLAGLQAAMAHGDLGAAFDVGVDAGILAADVELIPAQELAGVVTYRGREGLIEFMRTWTEDFEDWTVNLERTIDTSDDLVGAVLRQRGTGKGSGVPVELSHGAVFELHDGRITRIRLYLEETAVPSESAARNFGAPSS
jgi:ketosteroid isomerase-like protein